MLTLDAIDAHLDSLRAEQQRTTELFWVTWWEDVDRELDARLMLTRPTHPALARAASA